MKHKLKKIIPFAFILIAFIIFSCSEDYEIHEHNHNHSKIKVKPISINNVITNQKAFEKLTNPKSRFKTNSSSDRIINDTINNFSIETDNGIFIEDGNYNSYTFKITRPNGSDFLLENVVVSKKNEVEYETILFQYNITQQELDMIDNGEFVDLNGKINKIFLENSIIASEVTGKYYYNGSCYEDNPVYIPGNTCPEGIHDLSYVLSHIGAWDQCTYYSNGTYTATSGTWTWQSSLVPCDDGGGGGTSSGSGQYGGGGSGSGSTTTTPLNNCRTCPPAYQRTPCDKINDLKSIANIQTELSNMSNKVSDPNEWGRYKLTSASVIQTPPSTSSGEVSFPMPTSGQYVFMAHTHNSPASTTYSVFSWTDLVALADLLKKNKIDTNNFVAFLATADGTYYALTIENTQNFLKFFAVKGDPLFDMNIATKRVELASKYYGELVPNPSPIIDYNTTPLNDEIAFLNLLQNNNLGLSLLESNSTFTSFEKVTFNQTTGNIDKQPCL
ncbi:hypothetical protein [Flavobacterium lacisediminis]|uniref:DUF4329 domain-containing protein n=1 Tax=Flavobacterium lacisediminis TaxID=2989705 RepID=A0ABT3EG02_9FLAO|nr:hypothetical protein [Flavobacterium lacisediminis]MCW1147044.1 hypothetical protein [Flavobacterium lacisediminis]